MLPLLLTIAATIAVDLPAEDLAGAAELVRTQVFSELTEAQALQLEGRRARFQVELASGPAEHEGQVLYDCAGLEPLHPTVWFREEAAADLVEVEAVLVVIRHKESNGFAGFTELRLVGSRPLRER